MLKKNYKNADTEVNALTLDLHQFIYEKSFYAAHPTWSSEQPGK